MIGMHFTDPKANDPVGDVDWVRLWDCGVTWKDIHLAKGVYHWDRLDALMKQYEGKKILYVIAATPRWLAMNPNEAHAAPWLGLGSNSLPSDLEQFNEFVWNLSARYKGRIHAYEVWNEPQLADFLYPYTDANTNRLALMTKRAYRTIKKNDPSALVGAASILPRPSSGGMKRAGKYLRSLKSAGWNVDFFTCHIYPEPGTGAKRWSTLLNRTQKYLDTMNPPTKKLWITETAYGLLSPDPIPDSKAEELVRQTYAQARGRFVFWYAWNRPDLKGFLISHDTAGWKAVKQYG